MNFGDATWAVKSAAFMCDNAGNALPAAADGSQASGTPCDKIPQGLINPIGQKLMNLYPLPNADNAALGYNYVSEPVRKLNEAKFDIRMDENLSAKDNMFARFSYDQAGSYVPGGAPGFMGSVTTSITTSATELIILPLGGITLPQPVLKKQRLLAGPKRQRIKS